MIAIPPPAVKSRFSGVRNLGDVRTVRSVGQITKLVGLTLESVGPMVSVGDQVEIVTDDHDRENTTAEIVGFRDDRALLMPLRGVHRVRNGDRVLRTEDGHMILVGSELIGRVVNAFGAPIDGGGRIHARVPWPLRQPAPESMSRRRVRDTFYTGVRAIDAMLTCGCGQRIGIFAGSGVGKSSLLGMICRNASSDINVISLVGERGKEVLDFIEDSLGEGLARSIVVVVTSDAPPLQRLRGAETAMAIAEFFRDQGKNVLFLMDSVTRYAMAQREIGLAVGEPPATKGYPPSVFSLLPNLLERAGTNRHGSITAFCTVLVEGDDMNDPIADAVRGILDGHIVLSRGLAASGHYPAIDVLGSISRVMKDVADPDHVILARELRRVLAVYDKAEDMINIGAYKPGSNAAIDEAIQKKDSIDTFLSQDMHETEEWDAMFNHMKGIFTP